MCVDPHQTGFVGKGSDSMVRYDRQTKPGLVALYDIRPGNGAGPFLHPGARTGQVSK